MLYPVELRGRASASVRPGLLAAEGEVVGVGPEDPRRAWRQHLEGDAVALGVGDGLLLGVEQHPHLAVHVGRTGPAHQRIGHPGAGRLELQHPFLGVGLARLHGGLGRNEDARQHGGPLAPKSVRWSGREDSNLRPSAPKADALPGCATPRSSARRPFATRRPAPQRGAPRRRMDLAASSGFRRAAPAPKLAAGRIGGVRGGRISGATDAVRDGVRRWRSRTASGRADGHGSAERWPSAEVRRVALSYQPLGHGGALGVLGGDRRRTHLAALGQPAGDRQSEDRRASFRPFVAALCRRSPSSRRGRASFRQGRELVRLGQPRHADPDGGAGRAAGVRHAGCAGRRRRASARAWAFLPLGVVLLSARTSAHPAPQPPPGVRPAACPPTLRRSSGAGGASA